MLPSLPGKYSNSILLNHVNGGAANHPLLIIGSKDNGATVTCLQMTSFNDTPIEDKYHENAFVRQYQYIAIDHGKTRPHSSQPILRLANNDKLAKQSYVNLDQFFTIEASYLKRWGSGKEQLDTSSIAALERAFLHFISSDGPRQPKTTNSIPSPLDYRPEACTAHYLGVNDPRFVKPSQKNCAVTIVRPTTQHSTRPSTRPSTPPPNSQPWMRPWRSAIPCQ